jgi:Cdc6-like AAA superfamily ATPase
VVGDLRKFAEQHGDARKALMLLKFAGEIAVEKGKERVEESAVRDTLRTPGRCK